MIVVKGSFWKHKNFEYVYSILAVSDEKVTCFNHTDMAVQEWDKDRFVQSCALEADDEVGSFFRLLTGKIERGTEHSVGFDLFYTGESSYWDRKAKAFVPNQRGDVFVGDRAILLKAGVKTEMSPNLAAIMKEKSGLSTQGVELKAGVIDADYRDEWGVVARFPMTFDHHFSPGENKFITYRDQEWQPFQVTVGMKIAQFIIIKKVDAKLVSGPNGDIVTKDAKRSGGFGSTGA